MIRIIRTALSAIARLCTPKSHSQPDEAKLISSPVSSLGKPGYFPQTIPREETDMLYSILGLEDLITVISKEHINHRAIVNLTNILGKINIDNISLVLKIARENYEQERNVHNNFDGLSNSEALNEIIVRRSLKNEAIFCSLSKVLDLSAFQTYFNKQVDQKKLQEISSINDFLSSNIRLEEINTILYEIDIARRVGNVKKDLRYFANEKTKFEALKREILESLESFESRNKDRFDLAADEIPGYHEAKEKLTRACREEEFLNLQPVFYEQVCQSFATLCKIDFMLNQERLKELVQVTENGAL